jgi:inosine-uridine nucleoside N-ribohydrolase
MGAGKGRFGTFLSDISQFYADFHVKCYSKDIVYMHDPAAMLAVIRKDLFEWQKGPAIVSVDGIMRGKTLIDCVLLPF